MTSPSADAATDYHLLASEVMLKLKKIKKPIIKVKYYKQNLKRQEFNPHYAHTMKTNVLYKQLKKVGKTYEMVSSIPQGKEKVKQTVSTENKKELPLK